MSEAKRSQLPEFYTSDQHEVVYGVYGMEEALKLKPYPNRIIVRIDGFSYKGKIIIPDKSKRPPTTGKVLAVGENITRTKIGQTVVYGMYSGTALKFKDVPVLRVLTEDEILCEKEGSAEIEQDVPQE